MTIIKVVFLLKRKEKQNYKRGVTFAIVIKSLNILEASDLTLLPPFRLLQRNKKSIFKTYKKEYVVENPK